MKKITVIRANKTGPGAKDNADFRMAQSVHRELWPGLPRFYRG